MMDLRQNASGRPAMQTVPSDPGVAWFKDPIPVIEPPPDDAVDPDPEFKWPADASRSGVYGAVAPRVVVLPDGRCRMYYTQILPRPGFPAGANDYDNSSSRILSATSTDGCSWNPDPGVRLSSQQGGAGEFRVVSSEVVPCGKDGRLRMYYECCDGPQSRQNSIRSAISDDGLVWSPEPGTRFQSPGVNYSSPRLIFLEGGGCRLFCHQRGRGIVSASSHDGLVFHADDGIRIAPDTPSDRLVAFASEIVRLNDESYRMYYAGYSSARRAQILTAVSPDGLRWTKEPDPVLAPDSGGPDAAKCSEMCILPLPSEVGENSTYRMFYEACDGTAQDQRGVWRIAAATSIP